MNPRLYRPLLLDPQDPNADGGAPPVAPPTPPADPAKDQHLQELQAQLQELREEINNSGTTPLDVQAQTYERLRQSFQSAGYSPAQAQAYAVAMMAGDVEDDSDEDPIQTNTPAQPGVPGIDPRDVEIANLRRQMQELAQGQQSSHMAQLQQQLKSGLDGALDTNKGLATLMQSIPEDRRDAVRERWAKRLDRDTRARLSERRQKSRGAWDSSWIAEEAKKAAAEMYEDFRAGIPDPSKIGPGETVTEAQEFLKTKPVVLKAPQAGESVGDVQKNFRDFALDSLLRGQAEAAVSSSRV